MRIRGKSPMLRRLTVLSVVLSIAAACGDSDNNAAAPGGITTMQIAASGFTFDARVAGPHHGTPVLLLHGFPESSYEWRGQLEALGAAGYRAIAPDLRGYSPGARPAEVAAYRMDHLVGDVLAIADQLGFQT